MLRVRFACVVVATAVATLGCATTSAPDPKVCAALGAIAGAGGGAAVGLSNDKGSDWDSATGTGAIGAIGVGAAGYILCTLLQPKEEIAMAPAPPPPAPPPPPRAAPPPPAPPPSEGVRERIVLRGVNFDFDKADIRADAAVILDEAASILNRSRRFQVRVEGHTDSTGPAEYNQGLSERRAAAVKRYLVEQGVSASRLQTAGFGEGNPIAGNDTRDGRALNRRVELQVLE